MTDEITYPINKDDYIIDIVDDKISITLTTNYVTRNKENKKIKNTTNKILLEEKQGKYTPITTIGLDTILLPTTTTGMTPETPVQLVFQDTTQSNVTITLPTDMEYLEADIAEQINPIYCNDIHTLVDFIQDILFVAYNDSDVLSIIENPPAPTPTPTSEVPSCFGTQELTFTPTSQYSGDIVIGAGTGIIENGTTNYFLLGTDTTDDTKLNMYYITRESTTAIYEPLTPVDDRVTYTVSLEVDPETGDDIVRVEAEDGIIVEEAIAEKLKHTLINTVNRLVEEEEIILPGTEALFVRIPNPLPVESEENNSEEATTTEENNDVPVGE